ncbi:MAG: response regulator transcription factor [Zhaonellaceae bacterium]
MDSIKVLIVGEDEVFRKGIASVLASQKGFQVVNSLDSAEAVKQHAYSHADLILLDLTLIRKDSAELVQQLRRRCPCSKIVAIINSDLPESFAEIIANGIDSCLPEGIMRSNLIKAIELVCTSNLFFFPSLAKKFMHHSSNQPMLNNVLDINNYKVHSNTHDFQKLTKRELEILKLIAKNYTNKEIGKALFISEPTVKTHVSSILQKLGQSNRSQAILFAYKAGLLKDSLA